MKIKETTMHREYFIKNLEGIMYFKDIPLFEFQIRNRELISYRDLSNHEFWPCEPRMNGMSYVSLNNFFQRRVVPDYAQDIGEYLDAIGLPYYDFEELVRRNNGGNHLDFFWVRFPDMGAQCWNDILTQNYPIYS